MMRWFFLVSALGLAMAGCRAPEPRFKAIIGAMLVDGRGGPPVADAVIVTEGERIRGAGPRPLVPVPAGSEKVNGAGKFVVPGLIDLAGGPAVTAYLDYGVTYVRGALGPGLPEFGSEAEAKRLLDAGTAAVIGMPGGSACIDPDLVRRISELGVIVAPRLGRLADSPGDLAAALGNTKRLAGAGVRIAVASAASAGQQTHREIELLSQSGLAPMEAVVAATRNGALALGRIGDLGTIEPGKRADLVVLAANPLEDVRNLRRIERVMVNGEWAATGPPPR